MNFNEKFTQEPNATILVGHFIGGKMSHTQERTQPVYNPATGEVTKHVALADTQTVEHAIAIAQAAFPAWQCIIPSHIRFVKYVNPYFPMDL